MTIKNFLVKIGANTSELEGALNKANSSIQRHAAKFRKIGRAMTVAGTAVVGSVGLMIKKYVEAGDWIDKMSKRTGFGATALSELAYAADISGANLNDVERSVKRMAGSILDAHSGLESYARAFRQMGVEVDELMQMNPEQQFLTISEAIASIEDPTIRAALAQDVFGRAGTTLLPMMAEGKEGLRKLREEAHTLGIIFDQEAAAKAAKLKDAQTALTSAVKGLGFSLADTLIPAVTNFVQSVTGVIAKVNQWAKAHPELLSMITKIAGGLGILMAALGPVVMIVPKIVSGISKLGMALKFLLGPMGLVVAGATAITVALLKQKAAQEAATEAAKRAAEAEDSLFQKLKAAADQAGLSEKEFLKLRDAYNGNAAAMAMAIKRGKEGKELQEALANVSEKHKEKIEEQKSAIDASIPSVQGFSDQFKNLSAELEDSQAKTKTWIDYLSDMGLKTVKEKSDRVEELEGYLKDLNEAYQNGAIDLETYTEATRKTMEEIKDLSTTLTTTALPAARFTFDQIVQIQDQAVGEMEIRTEDFTQHTEKEVEKQEGAYDSMLSNVAGTFQSEFQSFMLGQQSVSGAISSIWDSFKTTVANIFSTLATKVIFSFFDDIVGKATSSVGGILDSFKGLGSGISDVFKGLSGAGAAAGGIWTGVGSAVGTFLGTMLGGGGAAGFDHHDSGNLQELRDLQRNTRDLLRIDFTNFAHIMKDHLAQIESFTGIRIPERIKTASSILRKIEDHTKKTAERLKNLPKAQLGAHFDQPTLALVGEVPETVIPDKKLGSLSASGSTTLNAVFNITAVDPRSMREVVRNQIAPEFIEYVRVGLGKTKLKEALA